MAHPDKLIVGTVNVGSTLAQGASLLESGTECRGPTSTFLKRLYAWFGSTPSYFVRFEAFQNVDSPRLFLISGSRRFADSLSGSGAGRDFEEDGPNILQRAEQAGWRIWDLSKIEVCT